MDGAIKLINTLPLTVEFRVERDSNTTVSINVPANDQGMVPTVTDFSAQATTTVNEFTLKSNPVSFDYRSLNLLGQLQQELGYYDFQLIAKPGTQPDAIVLENSLERPVLFKITYDNSPFSIQIVVDEHDHATIKLTPVLRITAVVNGIVTNVIDSEDPNAAVRLVSDGQDRYQLTSG